ncbi:MAG: PKD domain-containing protein [Bacteroidia bacterium]
MNLRLEKVAFFLAFIMVTSSCGKEEPGTDTKSITADFTITNNNCEAPCDVVFNNSSSNATSYHWDFGDGDTSTETSPSHTYLSDGDYEVTLTANSAGESKTISKTATIALYPGFMSYKIDGQLFVADKLSAVRITSDTRPYFQLRGITGNNSYPQLFFHYDENNGGFKIGQALKFDQSSRSIRTVEFMDASNKIYLSSTDAKGVDVLFSKLTFEKGGEVEATFSGRISSYLGEELEITEGKLKMKFSN